MPSLKPSESSRNTLLNYSPSAINTAIAKRPRRTAYIHNKALSRSQVASNTSAAEAGSPRDVPAGYVSPPLPVPASHVLYHDFDDTLCDPPPSSTPDLLSPSASSSFTSPEIPLAQQRFTIRLHMRLQAVLDQRRADQDLSLDSPVPQASREDELGILLQGHNENQREVIWEDNSDHDDGDDDVDDTYSETCWSVSPREVQSRFGEIHAGETPLTRQNKRKHDFSHGFSDASASDGDTTDVDDQDDAILPTRKKIKYWTGSNTSISTPVGYQTSETASSRKLRSLSSATSSFSSTGSTVVSSPVFKFVHPIIHPPSNPLHPPKSRAEAAEARIKLLLQREASYRVQDGLPLGPFEPRYLSSDQHEKVFGIEPKFRRKVVEWILDVFPPRNLSSQNLRQHLQYSEETRFHAMYLFSRYFLRLAEYDDRSGAGESTSMRDARLEITWDIAFCCLAISTKFYHDFLAPLSPICSRHFLAIAPQLLSHDQFERMQRDVLDAFDYEVHGVTPHAFFEELWDALPSLRDILSVRRTRAEIREEMWDLLQLAALECDIIRFPVSLLTAAALIESILITLVYEYEKEHDCSVDIGKNSGTTRMKNNCIKARKEIRPVSQDISKILGATAASLEACQRWLNNISKGMN